MNSKEFLIKVKPIIIILLLFSIVFFIRVEAVNLSIIPADMKASYQDQIGQPYFSEMDSYYNFRMTQDYLDHGYLGDTIINGTQWDLHSYYPSGRSAEYPPLIAYITAFVFKFLNLFTAVSLATVAYWIAPFIASLCVIPAYLFISRQTNDYGGIAAALFVALAPAYFAHTFAGFFDTDMFNIIMPILIIWFFVESIRSDNFRNRTIFALLSAFSLLVFSLAWEGWWYMFYIVLGIGIVYLGIALVSKYFLKKRTIRPFNDYPDKISWFKDQKVIYTFSVFIIAGSLLVMLNLGVVGFFQTLINAVGYTGIQSSVQGTSYPNVYVSVSELQIPSLGAVANGVGLGAFILGILCVPLLIWKFKPEIFKSDSKGGGGKTPPKRKTKPRRRKKKTKSVNSNNVDIATVKAKKTEKVVDIGLSEKRKTYLLYIILFAVWILFTAYTVTKGSRFIAAFSIPIGLGAGLFIGLIFTNVKGYIKNTRYVAVAMLVIIAVFAYPSISGANAISNSVVPGTDDSMYNSLLYIKNNTPSNTVITSWWDFGHLFAEVADRPVTFDGASQNNPRAYWVGKALLTSDENLSAGILRMLTSSGDNGYLSVENVTKNTAKSVEILDKILPVSKQNAQTILISQYQFTSEQAQNVLQYTHPDNPAPHVFITSSDMLGKAAWWSYFGGWNFQNNSGQHYMYSAAQMSSQNINGTTTLTAANGVVATISGNDITAGLQYNQSGRSQLIAPHQLTAVVNNKVVKNQIVSSESPISIFLVVEGNSGLAIVMNKELENSMFTRLFIFRGAGLSKFKIAYEQPGVTVWNVN